MNQTPRFLLFFLAFVCVPLAIADFLGIYALTLEEDFRRQRSAEALDRDLNTLTRKVSPREFLEDAFKRLLLRVKTERLSSSGIERATVQLTMSAGISAEAYVFDHTGKLVTPERVPLKSRFAMQKLWNLLQTGISAESERSRTDKFFRPLFGRTFSFAAFRAGPSQMLEIQNQGKDGFVWWSPLEGSGKSGVILLSLTIPQPLELLHRLVEKRLKPGLSLITGQTPDTWVTFGEPVEYQTRRDLFSGLVVTQKKWQYINGKIWVSTPLGETLVLAGKASNRLDLSRPKVQILCISVLCGLLLMIFWYRWIVLKKDYYLSIRFKLTLLFAFSVLLPLMGIAFLGYRTLRDQEEVRVADVLKAAGEELTAIDTGYASHVQKYILLFRRIYQDLCIRQNIPRISTYAFGFMKKLRLLRLEIRDLQGNLVFTTLDPKGVDDVGPVMQSFARACIDGQLQDRLATIKQQAPSAADVISETVLQSPLFGFPYIIGHPDQIHVFKFGDTGTFWYWNVFRDPGHPWAYTMIGQSTSWAIERFLTKQLAVRRGMGQSAFRLMVRKEDSGVWYPKSVRANQALNHFAERIRVGQQAASERLIWEGKRYLARAIPGLRLQNSTLVALYPEREIRESLVAIRKALIAGILMALFMSFLTGAVMADTFLVPISALSDGIEALRTRKLDHRVPVSQRDELGDLATTFNRMMEDVAEMELAKIVQDSLIPKHAPACEGYEIILFNQTATDLGGDYCDVIRLPDNRMLLLIGDVSGHGASSALLMTMAKAIVYQWTKGNTGLSDLFLKLNDTIHTLLKRQKLMTFFAGLLDTSTHKLEFCDAGHPFPFHATADGVKELKVIGMPLGTSIRNPRYLPQSTQLNPGDVVLFYTDGYVESLNEKQQMFGFDRLQDLMQELRPFPPDQIRDRLLTVFHEYHGTAPLDDDLTLVILKRNAEG